MLLGAMHSDLKTGFLQFASFQEKDVLRHALNDFTSVDVDDLLEGLNSYECRKKISTGSLPEILDQICHKELVQKTMFVIDKLFFITFICFSPFSFQVWNIEFTQYNKLNCNIF